MNDKKKKERVRNQLPKRERNVKTYANDSEKRHSKQLGGTQHPLSGGLTRGGDFSLENFTFDSKTTQGKRLTITGDEMVRVCKDASGQSKYPALAVEFGQTVNIVPDKWVMMPFYAFQELLGG
jgi:hypothetical protein